jgi:hypothetical protein
MKRLLTGAATTLLLGAAAIAPVIQVDAQMLYAYCTEPTAAITRTVAPTATSSARNETIRPATIEKGCFAIMQASDGKEYRVELSKISYSKLGEKDGEQLNPKKADTSLLYLLTPASQAAIAFDASTDLTQTTATSLTYAHTITGSNPVVVTGTRVCSSTVSGITWNGVAMSAGATNSAAGGTGCEDTIYYLKAPTTGTHNTVVSVNASSDIAAATWSYTGADQTSPAGGSNTVDVSSANSVTLNITTTCDNAWLTAYGDNAGGGYSPAAGTTRRNPLAGGNAKFGVDSNGAKTPTGSYSLGLTSAGAQAWSLVGMAVCPVAAAVAVPIQGIINFE